MCGLRDNLRKFKASMQNMNIITKIFIAFYAASVTLVEFGLKLLSKIYNKLKMTNLLKKNYKRHNIKPSKILTSFY